MVAPETRLQNLLPPAFQIPLLNPGDASSVGHQFIDLNTNPPYLDSLIRATIRVADLGVVLMSRSQRVLIYVNGKATRGWGIGEGFVTVTEAGRYSQALEEFNRYHQLSVVTHLEQRAEVLRRQQLLKLRGELWQNSTWQPTVLFHPLVDVEIFLYNQFEQSHPSRIGLLVDDDDKTGITSRIQQALIVNPTNLTVVGAKVKEKLEDLAERNGLMIRGNYWETGGFAQKPSYLYQVCGAETFRDTLFGTLRSNRELKRLIEKELK